MKVTVIIPIYNGEPFIPKMYSLLVGQTYRDFEIIYINDGSSDNSLDLLNKISLNDSSVSVYSQSNKGICASRNVGIDNAKGEYLIFLDQDDGIEKDLIENYVRVIEEKNVDLASFGKIHYFIENSNVCSVEPQKIDEELVTDKSRMMECLFNIDNKKRLMTIWNCIYKKDIIDKYNIRFDEHFKHGDEDGMFNIEYTLKCQRIYFSSKSYYHYYIRKGISTITKYNKDLLSDYLYYADKVSKLTVDFDKNDLLIVKLYLLRFYSNVYCRFCRFNNSIKDKVNFLIKSGTSRGFVFATSLSVHSDISRIPKKYIFWDLFSFMYKKEQYYFAVFLLEFLYRIKSN